MMRRVVVTGLGVVSPLGNNIHDLWNNLLYGKIGISKIKHFDTSKCAIKVAGIVENFNINNFIRQKHVNKFDHFIQYGLAAGIQAIEDSEMFKKNVKNNEIGIIIGSGIGGITTIEENSKINFQNGFKNLQPTFIPSCITNTIAGYLSMLYKITGPSLAISTACATGGHSICLAEQFIRNGKINMVIAGGSEKATTPLVVAGFSRINALSKNNNPCKASRPWDMDRDGFVLSDGAACLVLEEYQHALNRNAKIYAEICGTAMTSDAYNIVAPEPSGAGIYACMKNSIENANIDIDYIDYINAHATSTKLGDITESKAIKKLFEHNKRFIVGSTKSMTGHLLGAAGSLEAIITILSIKNKIILKNINLDHIDPSCAGLPFSTENKISHIKYAMSNSFGFGGTNSSIIFGNL